MHVHPDLPLSRVFSVGLSKTPGKHRRGCVLDLLRELEFLFSRLSPHLSLLGGSRTLNGGLNLKTLRDRWSYPLETL